MSKDDERRFRIAFSPFNDWLRTEREKLLENQDCAGGWVNLITDTTEIPLKRGKVYRCKNKHGGSP